MDYKKRYNEALESAKKELKTCDSLECYAARQIFRFFPELRESEDERIRKELYAVVNDLVLPDEQRARFNAYLEKQKEQKPLSTEETELNSIAFLEQMGYTCIPPGKEQKSILEVFGFKVGDAVKLKDGDGRKHIIKSFEEVKGIHGPNFYLVEFEDNSARDGIYPGEGYPNGYYTHMEKFEEEQKPVSGSSEKPNYHAEWSEEDVKMLRDVYESLYAYQCGLRGDENPDTELLGQVEKEKQWVKLLPERFNLQPKNEWSEEDKRAIDRACVALRAYSNGELPEFLPSELLGYADRLQSLRPQPETCNICKEHSRGYQEGLEAGRRDHWKPSKEQMEALRLAIEGKCPPTSYMSRRLEDLYEGLVNI